MAQPKPRKQPARPTGSRAAGHLNKPASVRRVPKASRIQTAQQAQRVPAHNEPAETPLAPVSTLPNKRTRWAIVLGVGVVLFAITALLAHHRTLTGWELHLFRTINDWPESLRMPMRIATIVPESLWIAVAAVAVVFLLKMYRLVWQLSVATIAGYGIAEVAKKLIGRPRPFDLVQHVHVRIHETGNGFPSGHTMIITVILLTLWPYLPRGWRWTTLVLIPAMALSRVYLGVHEPLDVVGGAAVGMMVVGAIRLVPTAVRDFFRFDY